MNNYNPNIAETATQLRFLTQHLIEGNSITSLEAMRYGIGRLASRIYELRPILERRGYELVDRWDTVIKANGRRARVKSYSARVKQC